MTGIISIPDSVKNSSRPVRALSWMASVFLLAGAVFVPVSPMLAENIVKNGGFEDGPSGWWGKGVKSGGVIPDKPAAGTGSMQIAEDFVCQDHIPVTGGKNYKISMKMRCEGVPDGAVYAQLSFRGGGANPGWYGPAVANVDGRTEKALFVGGGTQDWKDYSVVVRAPDGADQMLLYLRKINGTPGTAAFDEVQVEPTSEAVTKAQPPPLPPDGQIVSNGGFEKGASGWWGNGAKTGGVVTEMPVGGLQCLKVASSFFCQDGRPVEEGKRYKITMKIRSENAPEGSVYVQLSYRGASIKGGWFGPNVVNVDKRTEKALFVTGGTHGWEEYSCVVQAPPTAEQMLLYLRKKDGTDGAAYFDDVSMLPTEEPETTAAGLRREELAAKWLSPALPEADAAAGLAAAAVGTSPAPARLKLAENGRALYRVHVGTAAGVIELNSANDLADYLGRITGGNFQPLSHDAHPLDGPLIVVGRDNALTAKLCPDIDYAKLGDDGFVLRTVGQHIVIAGNTPGGTMYGVNWFLDHLLGVKWLSPDYTHVPASPSVELAAPNERQIPRFKFRQILSVEGQDKPFAARNLLNGNSHGAASLLPAPEIDHWDGLWQRPGLTASFYQLMPPKQYMSQHPDWFAGGQVAMMNPEVRQIMADGIIERLRGVPNYGDYWFGFMDNDWGWDMDPASAAFAKEHGGAPSAPRVDMTVDVEQRVRKVLPDAKLAFNAYHWSFTPPTNMAIPEDILVYPMTIHVDYSTPLNQGRNKKLGEDIAGWNRIAKTILLWDHVTNFNGFIQPTPNIYPIAESIRWLSGLENVFGYFAEGSWNTRSAEFASLRVWLMGRMLWDPQTNIPGAVAEYCDGYFGPAGKYLKQYIDLMHEVSVRSRAAIWEKTNVDSAMFTLDFITKADALFAQAESAAANDPAYLRHVRQARMCVDYVILVRRKEYADAAAREKAGFVLDYENRKARFNKTIEDEKVTQFRQAKTIVTGELATMIDMERKDSTPPEIARNLQPADWVEINDIGFNRYFDKIVITSDPLASDGGTVKMPGDINGPFIQLKHHKLPEEGLWDIYADVRVEAEDGAGPDEVAFFIGNNPPQTGGMGIKFSQLKPGQYNLIKTTGGPFRFDQSDGKITFIRGGGSKKVKNIYVDRFIFVRAKEGTAAAR